MFVVAEASLSGKGIPLGLGGKFLEARVGFAFRYLCHNSIDHIKVWSKRKIMILP